MTRERAIEMVGEDLIDRLDNVECDFMNTCRNDGLIEFAALLEVDYENLTAEQRYNLPVTGCSIVAYYYHTKEDVDSTDGDLCRLDWTVDKYEIE